MKSLPFLCFIVVSFIHGHPVHAEPEVPVDNGAPVPVTKPAVTGTSMDPERRMAMAKWNDAKFGLFLHWGVYSVLGGTYQGQDLWSAEWIQENASIPWKEYSATAADWNPSDFDAEAWVKTAQSAGMRYVVLTAKHHDGFAMYPTRASKYNLMDWTKYRGPDPLAALKAACRKHGLLFGIYYSPLEFRISPRGFDETDEKAVEAGFQYTSLGPEPHASNADVVNLAKAQIKELAETYKPDIFWFDGTWDKMGTWTASDASECEAAIRAAVPNVIINDRLGVASVDFKTHESKIPDVSPEESWEYCWNLGVFWGYNPRNYNEELLGKPADYIETLVKVASLGGNYLLNVGPDRTGKFHPMAVEYLATIGQWVEKHGECVRGTLRSPYKDKPSWGYVTCRPGKVYLIVKDWPGAGAEISIPELENKPVKATFLGDPKMRTVPFTQKEGNWILSPALPKPIEPFTVIVLDVEGMPQAKK